MICLTILLNEIDGKNITLPEGRLSDVAPTLLQIMGVPQPVEMTGKSLVAFQ